MKTRLTSLLAVVVLVLVMAVPAFAQNATQDGYTATAGQVQAQVDDESSAPVAATTSGGGGGGSLPFTGLDVALLAGAGVLLVGAGLGMRRLTQAPGHSHA
jgi:hypothetical protein